MDWEFCGVQGGAQDELHFEIRDNVCYPGVHGHACGALTYYPTSSPSFIPTFKPSGDPSSQPSGQPSAQPSGLPSGEPTGVPSNEPTLVPTALGTEMLLPELRCVPEPGAKPIRSNDTCLYVELMDHFGDGWTDDVYLDYWMQIRDDDSNIISETLNCSCPKMAGCIHPSDLNIDQLFYWTVSKHSDADVVPSYAWEVQWTVQIVEGGELK